MKVVRTKEFSVYEFAGSDVTHRSSSSFKIEGPVDKAFLLRAKRSFEKHGFCIGESLFSDETMKRTRSIIGKLSRHLIGAYDSTEDEFCDIDQDELCITRMPRIGRGKHNIHFDPQLSPQHAAVAELMQEGKIADVLSYYSGKRYSLRESGFSLTRPKVDELGSADQSGADEKDLYYGGMEWHSDGAVGEATVLLSLDGISEDMGPVRVLPGSHLDYIDGIGHSEEVLAGRREELSTDKIEYVYEPGAPLLFDARTLHSVSNNISSRWRILLWFIFDCY